MFLLCIALAAICNAVMDNLYVYRIGGSIFNKYDAAFWCKDVSWNKAKRVFGYKIDAWHLFKSAMIIFLCASAVVYHQLPNWWFHFSYWWLDAFKDMAACGIAWNMVFNLFYNKLLRRS